MTELKTLQENCQCIVNQMVEDGIWFSSTDEFLKAVKELRK
jgi:hypothetical protein